MTTKHKKYILVGVLVLVFLLLNIDFFISNYKFIFRGYTYSYKFSTAPKTEEEKITPNSLIISSLGITAPIVYINEKNEKAYQEALKNGVVHFPGTAKVGEFGNAYIFGHSSDYFWSTGNYKSVFALLPKIQLDSEITVSDETGTPFIYKVIESKRISAKDLSVLDQQGNKRKLLTLQTSYPIGTALARWVVIAELLQ